MIGKWDITSACNLHCTHCCTGGRDYKTTTRTLPLAEVRTAHDDAAAVSTSTAPQVGHDTAQTDVRAPAGTARGVPAGDSTTPGPAARPLPETVSAQADLPPGNEGGPTTTVRGADRSRTVRRLLIAGGSLVAVVALYLIVQLVLDQTAPPPDGGAQGPASSGELTIEAPWRLVIRNDGSNTGGNSSETANVTTLPQTGAGTQSRLGVDNGPASMMAALALVVFGGVGCVALRRRRIALAAREVRRVA